MPMKLDTIKGMTGAEEAAFILETVEILPAQYQTNVNIIKKKKHAHLENNFNIFL
jgi:hypothetical protein